MYSEYMIMKLERMIFMVHILQVDFPLDGPFGDEMARQFEDLAKSINDEPGFLWKI